MAGPKTYAVVVLHWQGPTIVERADALPRLRVHQSCRAETFGKHGVTSKVLQFLPVAGVAQRIFSTPAESSAVACRSACASVEVSAVEIECDAQRQWRGGPMLRKGQGQGDSKRLIDPYHLVRIEPSDALAQAGLVD